MIGLLLVVATPDDEVPPLLEPVPVVPVVPVPVVDVPDVLVLDPLTIAPREVDDDFAFV